MQPERQLSIDAQGDLHAQVIGSLSRPSWLVEGELIDHVWTVQVHNPKHVRSAAGKIRFDTAIGPNNYRTTDYESRHDLVTAKLLCYYMFTPAPLGDGLTSVSGVKRRIELYFEFVRWRNRQGIPRNSTMSEVQLEGLIKQLRQGGARAVRVKGVVAAYLEEQRTGRVPLPSYVVHGRKYLHAGNIANALGLNSIRALPRQDWALLEAEAHAQGLTVRKNRHDEERTWTGRRLRWGDDATVGVYAELLGVPYLLHRYRRHLSHDPWTFRPYPQTKVHSLARTLTNKEVARTGNIPAPQACYLIEHALTWVLEYAPQIRDFVEAVQSRAGTDSSEQSRLKAIRRETIARGYRSDPSLDSRGPWPVRNGFWSTGEHDDRPLLSKVVTQLLPAACMIVIAAFSARRCEEMNSLRAGAVTMEDGELWLECWISKTVRGLDKIPVPQSVANAVSILEWLSCSRREAEGVDWLYNFNSPFTPHGATSTIATDIRAFAQHVDVPPLADGSYWWFSPHQFRRFFGIIYYHHFRFAELVVLSNYYRHFDPDMTRRYISEAVSGSYLRQAEINRVQWTKSKSRALKAAKDRQRTFDEEGLNFRLERYQNILNGDERVSGFGGEWLEATLLKLRGDASAMIEIDPSLEEKATLDHLLRNFAEVSRLEPNPLGHSYCKCTRDEVDTRAAACLSQDSAPEYSLSASSPDPRFAADLTCSGCPHNIQFAENEVYWREMVEHEERLETCALGTLLGELAAARAAAAKAHLLRCFG